MCPYEPKHFKDSIIIRKNIIHDFNDEELDFINKKFWLLIVLYILW